MPTIAGVSFNVVGNARPVAMQELERCERILGARFPACYREFITQVGPGSFEDLPIRAFSPRHVCESTAEDQERLKQYWFWDGSAEILSQERGVGSIQCFDTDIGHDLRFLPSDPTVFYFMAHEDDLIAPCRDLADVVALIDPSFRKNAPFTFEPWTD